MKTIFKVVIALCVALPVISYAQNNQTLTQKLRSVLKDTLKDPESARFKGEFISRSEDSSSNVKSLCGYVNSKNAFGGYVGFVPFIVNTEGMVALNSEDLPTATTYMWPVWCGKPLK